MPAPYYFDYCSTVVQSEVREPDSSNFVFFLKIALAIQGLLRFHTNNEIICSSSVENIIDNLIGLAMNL